VTLDLGERRFTESRETRRTGEVRIVIKVVRKM